MIAGITFFNTVGELQSLTGIYNYDYLHKAGFITDGFEWGFVSNTVLDHEEQGELGYTFRMTNDDIPEYYVLLLDFIRDCYEYYNYTEYEGKHYYTVNHQN